MLEILIIFLKQLGLEIFKNKVYITLYVLILFYGREIWTLGKKKRMKND